MLLGSPEAGIDDFHYHDLRHDATQGYYSYSLLRKKDYVDCRLIYLYSAPSMSGKTINTKEAATIIGVTPTRVRQFITEGRFATARKIGRDLFIDENEVKRFGKLPRGKKGAPRRKP